jgi:hypothetical protein
MRATKGENLPKESVADVGILDVAETTLSLPKDFDKLAWMDKL